VQYILIDGQRLVLSPILKKPHFAKEIKSDLLARAQDSYGSFYVTEYSEDYGNISCVPDTEI
jgi:hypothetical protein